MDNIFVVIPIIVLIIACVGIVWSLLKQRKYLTGFIIVLLGAVVYWYGLFVGGWEGMGISFTFGGGIILLGLLTLLITKFIKYRK